MKNNHSFTLSNVEMKSVFAALGIMKVRQWRSMPGIGESRMIEIVFRNGDMTHYKQDQYTDYKYDGKYFIVIYEKQWIGFYNLDCVEYIEVERTKQ